MGKKKFGFKLGEYYFDKVYQELIIQSVWMWKLGEDLFHSRWNRSNDEFPSEFNNQIFVEKEKDVCNKISESIKKRCYYNEIEHIYVYDKDDPKNYFKDDAEKEDGLNLFIMANGLWNDEDGKYEAPFQKEKFAENPQAFFSQSHSYYSLASCYKFFSDIQKAVEALFHIQGEEFFLLLERMRNEIWYATGDILSYWQIKDKRRRDSKKGGVVAKRLSGILSAIMARLSKNPKLNSAQNIWDYFEKNHMGIKNAMIIEEGIIHFDYDSTKDDIEGHLFQTDARGITKGIGRSTFNGYVKEAKQALKEFTSK